MNGFLGTGATLGADVTRLIELTTGLALLVGMVLARRRQYRAHQYCQSTVVLLNLAVIAFWMAPSFHRQVSPQIPQHLNDSYYAVAALHAAFGTIAELLGLYILLVAGTRLLPKKWRFQNYKPWMRTCLTLWWTVILLGLGIYVVWYVKAEQKAPVQATVTGPSEAPPKTGRPTVKISNFKFEPQDLTVPVGATVEWVDDTGRHTVEADDESFKSDVLTAGGRFEHRFDKAGEYPYHCSFHGFKGGKAMAGKTVVTAAPPK